MFAVGVLAWYRKSQIGQIWFGSVDLVVWSVVQIFTAFRSGEKMSIWK